MHLRQLVETWKSLSGPVSWTTPDPRDRYMRFYTTLEIDGIVDAGLVLKGGTYADTPDRHVTFEMAIVDPVRGRDLRLTRMDWRDLKGGHSNKRKLCRGTLRRAPETHFHDFEMNYIESEGKMKRGKLPCARAVSEDIQTFEQLRSFVGTHFRINNINIVPPPNWEYTLRL